MNTLLLYSCADFPDIQYLIGKDVEQIRRTSALYLLKLKEQYRIPQVALDYIVEGTRSLLTEVIEHVQASVKSKLAELGIEPSELSGVFEDVIDPFDGIGTCFLQEKYYGLYTSLSILPDANLLYVIPRTNIY